jgi:hypothetical protein
MRSFSFILLAAFAVLTCPILSSMGSAQNLPIWNGSFTDTKNGQNYPFIMVGGDPQNGGTMTITTYFSSDYDQV